MASNKKLQEENADLASRIAELDRRVTKLTADKERLERQLADEKENAVHAWRILEDNRRAAHEQLTQERAAHEEALEEQQKAAQSVIDEVAARANEEIMRLKGQNAGTSKAWQASSKQFTAQLLAHLGKTTGAQAPTDDEDSQDGPIIMSLDDAIAHMVNRR